MEFVALLMVGESLAGSEPVGLGIVGGLSLLERQARMVLRAGASRVLVVAPALPAELGSRLSEDARMVRMQTAQALAGALADEAKPVLMLAPGLLLDERLIGAMVTDDAAPRLAVFAGEPPEGAQRLDSDSHWAGVALLPAPMVRDVAAGLGDWELSSTLVRTACEAAPSRLLADELPLYAPNRRRDVPFSWAMPETEQARARATDVLVAGAQKGCLDWPARFIHPPIENALVRLLLPTPVTPNMVTVIAGLLGVAAIGLFACGYLWWGLLLVLIVGPLDGVDGKLARVRHDYSKWGDLEHVLDKILEYGWFVALAAWFAKTQGLAAWLAAAGIIIFALSEAVSGEFFRRFTGRQLDDWGVFERRFRLVGGRRNTFFWSLIPFAAFGLWWQGYLMILGYAAVTFAVSQWRLLTAIGEYGRGVSDTVRGNFERTSYDFLPKSKLAAR